MTPKQWGWIIILGTIWGSSFLFNAILILEIGYLWVSAGRVTIGAIGCWIFVIALKKQLPTNKLIYFHFFLFGTISYAIPFALFPLSQNYLTAGVVAIIGAMTPIMTVILSQLLNKGDNITSTKTIGIIAGFIGVLILSMPALQSGGSSQIWAIMLTLIAAFCYAIANMYVGYFKQIDPSILAASSLSGAALIALPIAFIFEGIPILTTIQGWSSMLGIGLLASAIAFQIMFRLIQQVGAVNFSIVAFIIPISAIFLGYIFLGQIILIEHYLGMVGIFIGLLLFDGRIEKVLRKK